MVFDSVRGYVELASGLSGLTRARAIEVAHGLLSLPAAGIATGSKVAIQVGTLADELMSAAAANHSDLTTLVRSEVEVAATRLGLVPAQKLQEAENETVRLRAELDRLRSASGTASVAKGAAGKGPARRVAAPKGAAGKGPARRVAAPKGAVKSAPKQSAVTTRARPASG